MQRHDDERTVSGDERGEGPNANLGRRTRETIAQLIATALRYEGFDVRTAGDGASALASVRDLVVLDVAAGYRRLRFAGADPRRRPAGFPSCS
jgi:CheY-like chemotaxis protein